MFNYGRSVVERGKKDEIGELEIVGQGLVLFEKTTL